MYHFPTFGETKNNNIFYLDLELLVFLFLDQPDLLHVDLLSGLLRHLLSLLWTAKEIKYVCWWETLLGFKPKTNHLNFLYKPYACFFMKFFPSPKNSFFPLESNLKEHLLRRQTLHITTPKMWNANQFRTILRVSFVSLSSLINTCGKEIRFSSLAEMWKCT